MFVLIAAALAVSTPSVPVVKVPVKVECPDARTAFRMHNDCSGMIETNSHIQAPASTRIIYGVRNGGDMPSQRN